MTPEEHHHEMAMGAMRNNDARHKSNLETFLAPALEYVQQDNFYAYAKAWHDYCEAEARRLGSRADTMEKSGIERYPHVNKALEHDLLQQLAQALKARQEEAREERLKRETEQEVVPVQQSLFGE